MTAQAHVTPMTEPPCLTAALDYASRGFSVIPLRPREKAPLIKWAEFQKRRATEAEIRNWWEQTPEANIGIVTGEISGLVVLDVDGPEGAASLKGLGFVANAPTPIVQTGKGYHYFLKHPGGSVPNRAGMLRGLDVRGDGGFVMTTPSAHPNGKVYSFVEGSDLTIPLADPAAPLLTLMRGDGPAKSEASAVLNFADARPQAASAPAADRHAASALDREIGRVVSADEGTRNNVLNVAAHNLGQLVGAGTLARSEVERRLLAAAQRSGLAEPEARRTIESGLAAGMAQPRDLSAVGTMPTPRPAARFRAGAADPAGQQKTAPHAVPEHARAPAAPMFDIDDFRLDRMTAGEPPPRQWLVRGALPLAVPAIIYGPGGVGKSLAVLDLCLKVATRHLYGPIADPKSFLGPVPAEAAGAAVFVTLEDDKAELHRRSAALDPEVHRDGSPLYVLPGLEMRGFNPTLIRQEGRTAALTAFAETGLTELLTAVRQASGVPVRILAFDPAGDVLEGSEDDAALVKPLMRRMREIAAEHGCTVVLIGHTGKGQQDSDRITNSGMRGSGAWSANSRLAYGLWRPDRSDAEYIIRQLELEPTEANIGRVVLGTVTKKNVPTSLTGVRRYLQDQSTGLIIDVTDGLRDKRRSDDADAARLLIDIIREAAEVEMPFQIEGASGLYKGRADLPAPLNTWGENRLRHLGNSLLESRAIEKCKLGGRGAQCWLDVPGGGYATGLTTQIAAGSRAEALRLHRERQALMAAREREAYA